MPSYFLHTLHGRAVRDEQGEDLAGPEAAGQVVVRTMGEILRDADQKFWDGGAFSLICVDEAGAVVTGASARRLERGEMTHALHHIEGKAAPRSGSE